ncbi:ATP-binding cassette domain-containing protein, partial [Escherichia coli]
LASVGLDVPLDRPTKALSGGQKQRLALAGVLAMRPGLLRLDALDGDSEESRAGRAEALLRLAEGLGKDVGEARALAE